MEQIREFEELLQELNLMLAEEADQVAGELRSVRDDVSEELDKIRVVFS